MLLIESNQSNYFASKTGLRLVVHNQSEVLFTLNDGIEITPGFETYVGVKREFTNKLSKPYSNCLNDLYNPPNSYAIILFNYFEQLNVSYYDQKLCFTMCYQDKMIDQCNCSDVITPKLRNMNYCVNSSEILCLNRFKNTYTTSDIDSLCENACPEKCNHLDYDLVSTSSAFPSYNYLKILQSSIKYGSLFPQGVSDNDLVEFARNGFLRLIVNYDKIYYTSLIEHASMDSNSLFGFLGGQLGEQ